MLLLLLLLPDETDNNGVSTKHSVSVQSSHVGCRTFTFSASLKGVRKTTGAPEGQFQVKGKIHPSGFWIVGSGWRSGSVAKKWHHRCRWHHRLLCWKWTENLRLLRVNVDFSFTSENSLGSVSSCTAVSCSFLLNETIDCVRLHTIRSFPRLRLVSAARSARLEHRAYLSTTKIKAFRDICQHFRSTSAD